MSAWTGLIWPGCLKLAVAPGTFGQFVGPSENSTHGCPILHEHTSCSKQQELRGQYDWRLWTAGASACPAVPLLEVDANSAHGSVCSHLPLRGRVANAPAPMPLNEQVLLDLLCSFATKKG